MSVLALSVHYLELELEREHTSTRSQSSTDDGFVLNRVERAGRVDESTARLEILESSKQDAKLESMRFQSKSR